MSVILIVFSAVTHKYIGIGQVIELSTGKINTRNIKLLSTGQ